MREGREMEGRNERTKKMAEETKVGKEREGGE